MTGRLRRATAAALALARRHPRHLVLFAAVAGLVTGPVSPGATLAAAAVACAIAVTPVRAALPGMPAAVSLPAPAPAPALGLACLLAVLGGATVADARERAQDGAELSALTGRPLNARAVVLEPVRERAAGPAVARVRIVGPPASGAVGVMRVRAAGHPGRWPEVGELVDITGRVSPLGRFDAYQRRRGAAAAIEVERLRVTGVRRGGLPGVVDAARRRAERGLRRDLDEPRAALLAGMVLGQDERLGEDVRTDFQRSGLAHILAVSGQNVMLLATLVLAFASVAGIPLRLRLLVVLVLVGLYVPLAGGGPSIQRAGVMGAAGVVAALAGRPASRWYALGLAAAVTLTINPRSAGEPGWQLSFAAVVALLALAPGLRAALARRLPGPLADVVAITVAATVGTAPLLALHFGQVSLVSLPANLVAAPVVAPVMWLGMLSAATAQVSPALAGVINHATAPLLGFVATVAHVAAAAPAAVLPVRIGSAGVLVLAYVVLGAVALGAARLWRLRAGMFERDPPAIARPGPRRLAVSVALVLAVVLVVGGRTGRPLPPGVPGELVVSFLDIGQGDATLLQRDGVSVLVDTGPPGGPILRRLAEAGVRTLDALVLTHAQADHEGAALAVMRSYPPRLLVDGGAGWPTQVQRGLAGALRGVSTRRLDARAGQAIAVGGMRLRLLWPPPRPAGWVPSGDPNDRAVVALVQVGAFDLLLPADAESNVTAGLDFPPVEALKVAHHGSADAGLPGLLTRLRPQVAAIEVGRDNTYGHPAPSTLAALRGVPRVVRTDRDGTVRLHVLGESMRLEQTGVPG